MAKASKLAASQAKVLIIKIRRERDLAYDKSRWRCLQIFFALILMINAMQSFAQSGASCSNPINIGQLTKDTIINISIDHPDSVKWLSFSSNNSLVSFLASSNIVNGKRIKIKELNIYNTSCVLVSANPIINYPGADAEVIRKHSITSNQTYLLKITRYYDVTLNDTNNIDVVLNYTGGSSSSCGPDLCNGIVYDGGFENYILSPNGALNIFDLQCIWFKPIGGGGPTYFNENYSDLAYQIPNPTYLTPPAINLPTQIDNVNFSATNTGYIGLRTSSNNSDIVQGSLTQSLQASSLYFISYLVSPGSTGYNSYHDRIDLDIVDPSVMYNYQPNNWGTNYSNASPDLESGIIYFTQTWTRVSNVITAVGGESTIYIGNLAKQAYSNAMNTNPANTYYVDNLIVKPFELELGPDILACEGQVIDLTIPCQYLYPGATYEWDTDDPNITLPYTQPNLSITATGNYYYKLIITVTNPQGGTESVTDVINVTITPPPTVEIQLTNPGPAGTWCEFNHEIYFVNGNPIGLTGTGLGINGTYNWFYNGVLIASNTASLTVPWGLQTIGDYEIELVGIENGCSANAFITVHIVTSRCQLPCNTVLGQSAFQNPNNNNALTNYTSGPHDYVNTSAANFGLLPVDGLINPGLTYVIDGTFTINNGAILNYNDVTFLISPGGKIINNGQINFTSCTIDACEQMWDRIDNNGTIVVLNSNINHAEAAIELRANSSTKIAGSTFTNNIVSVFSRDLINVATRKPLNHFSVVGTIFQGVGNIPNNMRFTNQFSQYTGLATGNTPLEQPQFYLRPANGINVRAVRAINIGISTNNAFPNHFINMWNGITFNNTAGLITNCRFIGMEANANHGQLRNNPPAEPQDIILTGANPNYATHYLYIVTNAIANIGASDMVVESLNNDDGNNPTINNCFRGIFNLGSNIRTAGAVNPNINGDYLFIRNVSTGARTEGAGNLMVVNFHLLDIDACVSGIVSYLQGGGSLTRIRFNNISMNRLPGQLGAMIGIQQRQTDNTTVAWDTQLNSMNNTLPVNIGSPNVNVQILNNVIISNLGQIGVEIFAGTNTQIRDNYIEMNLSSAFNAGTGIYLMNCFNSTASCNFITSTGLAPNAQPDVSRAIRVESSLDCDVTCNQTSNFSRGFYLNFISHGSNWEGNEFGSHRVGLEYFSWAEAGDQNDNGNRFVGPFTQFGARSFMQLSVVSDNEFRVNLNTIFDPITISGPLNWFQGSNNNPFLCNQNGFNCNFFNPNALVVNPNENGLIELSGRGLDSSEFAEEKVWMTKNYVAKVLNLNDSLITNNDSLRNFHDNIANTPMQALNVLMANIDLAQLGTASQLTILNATIIEKDNIFNAWLTAIQINDSASALQLSNQLLTLNEAESAIRTAIHNEAMNSQASLLAELNTIVAENNIEQYLIEMLSIYLNSVFINDDIALNNSESALANMAYQCPMAAGPAVYWARGMYYLIHAEAEFNDELICNVESNQRIEAKKNKINASNYQLQTLVYPNPTQNIVNILTKNEEITSISVTNSIGNQILNNISFQKNASPFQIDLSDLPAGFYFIEINYTNGKSDKRKITIIK